MKKMKVMIAALALVGILGAVTAFASTTGSTPADITASLTGKTVAQVNAERQSGKTYGAIAQESGKLDEFKAAMLEQRKVYLDQQVKDGKLTQQQADDIYNRMKTNMENCTTAGGSGLKNGSGFGGCGGAGLGSGMGRGAGYGRGFGMMGSGR